MPRIPRTIAARLRREDGYTLVELLIVMMLLAIVLGAIVTSFTIGIHQQVDQSRREGAYAIARQALQRMRLDLHCASGGHDSVQANAYGGYTLTLTQSNSASATGWCPGVIPNGTVSSGVQWCTIPETPGSTTTFRLYRFLGTNPTDCNGGAGSTFEADFVAQPPAGWPTNVSAGTPTSWAGNIWPTPETCQPGWLPAVSIDLNVALEPVAHPEHHYELRDTISLRNAIRCT